MEQSIVLNWLLLFCISSNKKTIECRRLVFLTSYNDYSTFFYSRCPFSSSKLARPWRTHDVSYLKNSLRRHRFSVKYNPPNLLPGNQAMGTSVLVIHSISRGAVYWMAVELVKKLNWTHPWNFSIHKKLENLLWNMYVTWRLDMITSNLEINQ